MTEFERGVREGVNNALAYFRDENGFSTVDEESGDSLDRIEAQAIEETLRDEAQRTNNSDSQPTASTEPMTNLDQWLYHDTDCKAGQSDWADVRGTVCTCGLEAAAGHEVRYA